MKLLILNFDRWSYGASNSRTESKIYERIYFRKYIWTPFVWLEFKKINKKKYEKI
jgi:hypothetical protein